MGRRASCAEFETLNINVAKVEVGREVAGDEVRFPRLPALDTGDPFEGTGIGLANV
jgi:hypothetical protein